MEKVVRFATGRDRQQIVVVRVGRNIDWWQGLHHNGDFPQIVDQATGQCRFQAGANFWLARHPHQFVKLRGSGQQNKATLPPMRD